jgi:hypothetical protein
MFRHALLALTLTMMSGLAATADTIGPAGPAASPAFTYSASASPFESFEWTSLDLAAFNAYGGDFANVRRPVTPVLFFEDPLVAPAQPGPEDEQAGLRMMASHPYFADSAPKLVFEELPAASQSSVSDVPEPGTLMLVGLGLLGASHRLRRSYNNAR